MTSVRFYQSVSEANGKDFDQIYAEPMSGWNRHVVLKKVGLPVVLAFHVVNIENMKSCFFS